MKSIVLISSFALLSVSLFSEPNTDWDLLGNSSNIQHHSNLEQINKSNIKDLGITWVVDLPTQDGLVGNPLIKDGRIFQSGSFSRIFANDLKTGEPLWIFDPVDRAQISASLMEGFATRTNRGVALFEDLVIVASRCKLFAVDQATGMKRWEAPTCDTKTNWTGGAPRVGGGMVFIGNSGFDSGLTRGFVDAFDAKTGKKVWRFYTVPGNPKKPQDNKVYEMAVKTWGEGWYDNLKGGGNVWEAMSYDEKLGLLYIGVGGSALNPRTRGKNIGDELFTTSIVALDAKTGEYVWHFKMNPKDGWNYEPSIGIMISELPLGPNGENKRVVISVPKNGFVFVIEARTGKYLSSNNYVDVNWTTGHDENGRPIYTEQAKWWKQPPGTKVRIKPGGMGSHSFEALAYDPSKNVLFIPAMNLDYDYTIPAQKTEGLFGELGVSITPSEGRSGKLIAWDPVSQKEIWSVEHERPMNSGLLHSSAGIVFQGTAEGYFKAYDSSSGQEIWSKATGGAMRAAPSSVLVDGKQLIVVSVGRGTNSMVAKQEVDQASTDRSRSQPRLLAFAIGGTEETPAWQEKYFFQEPKLPKPEKELAALGATMFHDNGCEGCHGIGAKSIGGGIPDLRMRQYSQEYIRAVMDGALVSRGMPKFDYLSDSHLVAINSFLLGKAWESYEDEDNVPYEKENTNK